MTASLNRSILHLTGEGGKADMASLPQRRCIIRSDIAGVAFASKGFGAVTQGLIGLQTAG